MFSVVPTLQRPKYLLDRFNILLVSFLFTQCPHYLVSPTNAHQLSLQIIQLTTNGANRNLTENRDLGNLCATCRTKNCRSDFSELPSVVLGAVLELQLFWTAFCDFPERSGGISLLLLVRAIQLQWQH